MVLNKVSSGDRIANRNAVANSQASHLNQDNLTQRNGSLVSFASGRGKKYGDASSTTTGHSSISCTIRGCCVDDPRTLKGRRYQMTKIVTMASVPIMILIIQTAITVSQALNEKNYASSFISQVNFAIQAGSVVHALGLERGTSTFFIASGKDESLYPPVLVR